MRAVVRVLLGAALMAGAVCAFAVEGLSGYVQQNTAANTETQNPDGQGYKWVEERMQLKLDRPLGDARMLVNGDLSWDHLGRGGRSELREAYLEVAALHWDARIGRQVMTWGLADMVALTDVFARDYEAVFSGRPMAYYKRGVDAVKLGIYGEALNLEAVWLPAFRASELPDPSRFHLFDPMPAVTNRSTVQPKSGEGGLRLYRDLAGWDAALYVFRGLRSTPSMRADSMTAPTRIEYFHPRLQMTGASLSGRLGPGVLSLEAAVHGAPDDPSGQDFTVPNADDRAMLAYQFQPLEDLTVSVQAYAQRMRNYEAYLASVPAGFPAEPQLARSYSIRLTQWLMHQTLRLSLYASYAPVTEERFFNPELRYSFNDRMWAALGANIFGGQPTGMFGQLARDNNVYLQWRYAF